ncbi:hypothetical protein [Polyangium fumosum]|uniref:Uncharacterized protein n=1 Tax=Polyangium fumosum TaxID=889272 RepID=A0A4U1J2V3_9BACT|nr:hypothetical protein [Polyangium fumosum]TKD01361.1 hypothetical protein E8A74_31450 [Polyangium fumosum]
MKARIASTLFAGLLLVPLAACGPADEEPEEVPAPGDPAFVRDPALDVDNISAHGEARSHNMGLNCMNCHQAHGPGKGRFTAAGTAIGPADVPLAGGTVELRTAPNGQGDLVLALEIDDNGNFFSTEPLPFPDESLFPFVRAPGAGGTAFMPFPTISGACNVCHVGAQRVRVE